MQSSQDLITSRTKLILTLAVLTILVTTWVPRVASAAQGDLDVTFSGDGLASTDFSPYADVPTGVALQSDGKIVVAGYTQSGADYTTTDFALTRYNTDGTPDLSFGTNGKVTTDFAGSADYAYGVAIQADGKIVAAGQAQVGMDTDFALARYNSDGSLDASFGVDGKVTTGFIGPFGSHESLFCGAIAIQTDGKILAGGNIYAIDGNTVYDFALARYKTDGSLDTTFGSDGWVFTDFAFDVEDISSLVIQPDGKIVAGGITDTSTRGSDFALARYDTDGTLDLTFGPDGTGKVTSDFAGGDDALESLVLQPDGAIVAAGYSTADEGVSYNLALARYTSDGVLDTTFDSDGKVTTSFAGGNSGAGAVVVKPNGLIIAGGYAENGSSDDRDFALVGYNPDGSLSQTFGVGGKITTAVSAEKDVINAMALQPDGKLVAAGRSGVTGVTGVFAVARYLTAGAPLLNISTRGDVGTGDRATIGGFIVTGTDPKKILLRAIGPSLPIGATPLLADPVLELHEPDGTIVTNDNWRDSQEQEITDTGIPPTNNLESAIVATLSPGAYTAILRGNDGGTGVGLVEAYDLDEAANSQLGNISTRGFVQTGDNVLIGGFIVGDTGADNTTVVIRGLGPSLATEGVTTPLQDPTLELHNSDGDAIAFNDDWKDSQQDAIEASGLAPTFAAESVILMTLSPGGYTAILRGSGGTTGNGLVEIYNLP